MTSHYVVQRRSHWRAGFTLGEVAISSVLVGVTLVGALDCLGNVIRGRKVNSDQPRGAILAQQMMSEILSTDYVDDGSEPQFGREVDELGSTRQQMDDVDDLHLWSANPPQDRLGLAAANAAGWQRDVKVELVDPDEVSRTVLVDQGVKRVTVTVSRDGKVVTQLVALRSNKYAP